MGKRFRAAKAYLRGLDTKNLGNRARFSYDWHYIGNPRNSASKQNVRRFGRLFLATEESAVGVSVIRKIRMNTAPDRHRFNLKLGFSKGAVFVEAIEGANIGSREEVEQLNQSLGMPWPNFLLSEVENHARGLGFKHVKIHSPETSTYHTNPLLFTDLPDLSKESKLKISKRINSLKTSIEKGFKPSFRPDEIRALELFSMDFHEPMSRLDGWRLCFEKMAKIRAVQAKIKNFVSRVATQNGYKRQGDVFVKKL